jgi:hypothetical protein
MDSQTNINNLVKFFFTLQLNLKLYHWNTTSYSRHKASDQFGERLLSLIDRFVEVLLPDYVSAFANNFTVNVTHVFNEDVDTEPKTYAATPVKNNSFRIYGPEGTVSWVVYGKRP